MVFGSDMSMLCSFKWLFEWGNESTSGHLQCGRAWGTYSNRLDLKLKVFQMDCTPPPPYSTLLCSFPSRNCKICPCLICCCKDVDLVQVFPSFPQAFFWDNFNCNCCPSLQIYRLTNFRPVWLISHQYFSLRTHQPSATSQQYFSLRTNQHQPPAKRTGCSCYPF
jgi:hypothetical protein